MAKVVEKKLSTGDFINWAEPKSNVRDAVDSYCVQCGRKVGKVAYYVEVSTSGRIMKDSKDAFGDSSQGCWAVGSECAKEFDPAVLFKY